MIYAYKRPQGFSTVVAAALNKEALEAWYNTLKGEHYTDVFQTDMMTHLVEEEFKPFQAYVYVFEHDNAEQQDAFVEQHSLLVGTPQRAVDRSIDMVNYDAPDHYDIADERTIEEIYGLDKEDKWDKRSDEEREVDEKMKEQMKELRKSGDISDESFSPRKDSKVQVTDIRTSVDADGNVQIDNVLAVKYEAKTNATLAMTYGAHSVTIPVIWEGRDLKGSEDLCSEVFFPTDDKYVAEISAGIEPKFQVTLNDGSKTSEARFQDMTGGIFADEALA